MRNGSAICCSGGLGPSHYSKSLLPPSESYPGSKQMRRSSAFMEATVRQLDRRYRRTRLRAGTWRWYRRRWLFCFRCAGRRDRPRCWANRWFAGRTLRRRRRILLASQLRAFFQPLLVISRRIDDKSSLHSVVTETTKLAANHFVSTSLDRLEPHRNE